MLCCWYEETQIKKWVEKNREEERIEKERDQKNRVREAMGSREG